MRYLCIGKIVNTHGIKGEVRILSDFKYKSKVLVKYFKVYVGKQKEEHVISSYRPHKQFDMITMEGITDINDVLKYKGSFVYINRDDLKLDDGEYLDEDLIGLSVLVDGEKIGEVVRIEKGPQDRIVVNKNGILCLVPYVCDIIKQINLEEGIMTLENIKGLLD